MGMSPNLDGGNSQLGVTLPNELKAAVYETAHDKRVYMSEITRDALRQWFEAKSEDELPEEALDNLRTLDITPAGTAGEEPVDG
jgi:hypothetical protein